MSHIIKKINPKELAGDLICDAACGILNGISVAMFTAPNHIAPGGVTGIATIINYLSGLPIGTVAMLINIPLLLVAYKILGKRFTLLTLKSTFIMSFFIDLCAVVLPPYRGNLLLAAMFGGAAGGIGLGLVFMRGSTTGGTDIMCRLAKLKYPHLPFGKVLLILDGVVILAAALVYRNMESALYALITILASSKMIDMILYGMDKGKVVYVVSTSTREIAKAIIEEMDRSATLLKSVGAYSQKDQEMLMCAVRDEQYPTLKKIVLRVDKNAFMIVADAGEILGEGWRGIDTEKI
ncbi:YitT family protein [Hydrogenoanaerobacterium sp.]|uniref:YitT family protein n=1 Tax=Hydrogenoanaerobacterium sp. TaxID=2953763 RepID=UPI00289F8E87|nr:YitT family protein [Hydrogenoanaerobacterium sp.]